MKATVFGLGLGALILGTIGLAQDYGYSGAYWGPYPQYDHASTAAEGAMRGMSDIVRSAGQANLLNSEAAINMTEAARRGMENREQFTDTYFQMRAANKQYRATERGPRPTMEDFVRYAQAGKPERLSPSELDTVTGEIDWPPLLTADRFAAERAQLNELMTLRAQTGGLNWDGRKRLEAATDSMLEELKTQVKQVPPQDYVVAKNFIQSLAFEANLPAG